MIAYLSGNIRAITDKTIILETQGVGYQVGVLASLLSTLSTGARIELFTYMVVRENLMELYGFRTIEEVEFFKKLLGITTIGPRTALGIMGIGSLQELQDHIAKGDPKTLQGYPGIGKKTAERLILELKHIFSPSEKKSTTTHQHDVDALTSLGYSRSVARSALAKVAKSITGTEERVQAALKILGSS